MSTLNQPTTSRSATEHRAGTSSALVEPAILGLRVALGAVMIAHGAQKLATMGLAGTGEAFAGMGIPAGAVLGPLLLLLELVGGAAMVVGVLTRVIGGLFAVAMIGASILVHAPNGFYAADGGVEFTLVLAVLGLFFLAAGPGRYSVDAKLMPMLKRRGANATDR